MSLLPKSHFGTANNGALKPVFSRCCALQPLTFNTVSTSWLLTRGELFFKSVIFAHRGVTGAMPSPGISEAGGRRGPKSGIIERGVSVWQNGGAEHLGNCRSAAKTQRKLPPRRKVGARAAVIGAGVLARDRLASQRIYTHSVIFLLLVKAFPLVAAVVVLCASSPTPDRAGLLCCTTYGHRPRGQATGSASCSFLELSDRLLKPELEVSLAPPGEPWQSSRKSSVTR